MTVADEGHTPTQNRVMYVCTLCADENPEGCGHYDRRELAVMPDGSWLCEQCWDYLPISGKFATEDDDRSFDDFPNPPVYSVASTARGHAALVEALREARGAFKASGEALRGASFSSSHPIWGAAEQMRSAMAKIDAALSLVEEQK